MREISFFHNCRIGTSPLNNNFNNLHVLFDYSLVECNGEPRIKLSEEIVKVTLPGRKRIYRLYGGMDGKKPLLDLMMLVDEDPPIPSADGDRSTGILCRDPFQHQHRIRVFPTRVKLLQSVVFEGGKVVGETPRREYLSNARDYLKKQLSEEFHENVTSYEDPVRYDVVVSPSLFRYLHDLWEKNAPVPERR